MRASLLARDPGIESVDMPTLVDIAAAIEHESVQRYAMLAETMERRGERATAAAFRVMLEEERRHVDSVAHWAYAMGQQVRFPEGFAWRLPADLSTSWEEVAGSALLTPYRAFAIAVDNEVRAFTFYTYLSARAEEDQVRAQAERLAREELRHAALMRRWRRKAWHLERGTMPSRPSPQIDTIAALHELMAGHEAETADSHRRIAARLRTAGDEESAQLLESLRTQVSIDVDARASNADALPPGAADAGTDDPVHLLTDAQRPLERFGEALEGVMRASEGELFGEADRAMATVVTRLARLALLCGERMAEAPADAGTATRRSH